MNYNKVILIGNVTRDPELKSLPSGAKVTSLSIATNRVWKDANGAKKEQVDFHNIVIFGRQAETVAQYIKKGGSLLIEGRLQTRSWDGTDGKKNYRTEVVADHVTFGPRPGGASAPATARPADAIHTPDEQREIDGQDGIDFPDADPGAEDIPF